MDLSQGNSINDSVKVFDNDIYMKFSQIMNLKIQKTIDQASQKSLLKGKWISNLIF